MSERKCPECGEKLSFDALRCACGWGLKRGEKAGRVYDHRCTFTAGRDRCAYPVGMFPEGSTSGWCIFHRNAKPEDGAEIVRQSHEIPYAEALKPIQERAKGAPGVVNTSHEIALRVGNRAWPSDAFGELKTMLKEREAA